MLGSWKTAAKRAAVQLLPLASREADEASGLERDRPRLDSMAQPGASAPSTARHVSVLPLPDSPTVPPPPHLYGSGKLTLRTALSRCRPTATERPSTRRSSSPGGGASGSAASSRILGSLESSTLELGGIGVRTFGFGDDRVDGIDEAADAAQMSGVTDAIGDEIQARQPRA